MKIRRLSPNRAERICMGKDEHGHTLFSRRDPMTLFDNLTGSDARNDHRHNAVRYHGGRELTLSQMISENAYRIVRAFEERIRYR